MLAINPKEYFEYFENKKLNKKHKCAKKRYQGVEFENFARTIK